MEPAAPRAEADLRRILKETVTVALGDFGEGFRADLRKELQTFFERFESRCSRPTATRSDAERQASSSSVGPSGAASQGSSGALADNVETVSIDGYHTKRMWAEDQHGDGIRRIVVASRSPAMPGIGGNAGPHDSSLVHFNSNSTPRLGGGNLVTVVPMPSFDKAKAEDRREESELPVSTMSSRRVSVDSMSSRASMDSKATAGSRRRKSLESQTSHPCKSSPCMWDLMMKESGEASRSDGLRSTVDTGARDDDILDIDELIVPDGPLRCYVRQAIESSAFESTVTGCVILNAVAAGIGAGADSSWNALAAHRSVEIIFLLVFVLELSMKGYLYGWSFFTMRRGWRWNMADLMITVLQFVGLLVSFFLEAIDEDRSAAGVASWNVLLLRLARLPRMLFAFRFLRLVRFFQELHTMVESIASSVKSLLWTILLLFLLVYVMGVYLTGIVTQEAHRRPEILEGERSLGEYYGNLWKSLLTLFQATTGGVNWRDALRPLVLDISPLLAIPFSLYIAFTVLAMMNVITGIFVDTSVSMGRQSRDQEVKSQMRLLFERTDADGSGMISWEEFATHVREPDMLRCFKLLDIDPSEAKGLFTLLDTDGSDEIDLEEFVMGCLRLQGTAKAIDLATLMYFNKRMATWWQERMRSVIAKLDCILDATDSLPATQEQPGQASPVTRQSMRASRETVASEKLEQARLHFPEARPNARRASRHSGNPSDNDEGGQEESQSLASYATWAGLKAETNTAPMGARRSLRRPSTIQPGIVRRPSSFVAGPLPQTQLLPGGIVAE